MAAENIAFSDYVALSKVVFEWADSYDGKDWGRLRAILAPHLRASYSLHVACSELNFQQIDYSNLKGKTWAAMPAEDFIAMVSGPHMFGDELVRTQHLIGASKLEKLSESEVRGFHQMRSRTSRIVDVESGATAMENDRSTVVEHLYIMIESQWKLAGIKPSLR